ncbi:MAG: hypothetical protein ABEI98_00410 [Halorhabdus sp.]
MTLPDPTDVIAPRCDDLPYGLSDSPQQRIEGSYPYGVVLDDHGLKLYRRWQYEHDVRVYDISTEDGNYVVTVTLNGFRTITEVEQCLAEIGDYDPTDRDEWVSSR